MWELIRRDLTSGIDRRFATGLLFWVKVLGKSLVTPQIHAVLLFRASSVLARTPLRPFAFVLRSLSVALTGAEIHPDARIGPGLVLVHSAGVVVGGGVVIGSDCRLAQGATLGEPGRGSDPAKWGFPVLGDWVTLGAHAVVLGPQRVGSGSVVAANSVVTSDVPDGVVVAGAPARVLSEVPLRRVTHGDV
jgi:serine O-acetyltransferase